MPGLYRADYDAIQGYVEAARGGRAAEWIKTSLERLMGGSR